MTSPPSSVLYPVSSFIQTGLYAFLSLLGLLNRHLLFELLFSTKNYVCAADLNGVNRCAWGYDMATFWCILLLSQALWTFRTASRGSYLDRLDFALLNFITNGMMALSLLIFMQSRPTMWPIRTWILIVLFGTLSVLWLLSYSNATPFERSSSLQVEPSKKSKKLQ